MLNKNFISFKLFSVAVTLLFVTGCKPSLKKESNAIRQTISIIDTISHDNIPTIKNLIKESHPALEAYRKKVVDILTSADAEVSPEDIFSNQKQLISLYTNNVERYDKHLTGAQRKVFRKSMLGGVKRSFEIALELDTLATPQFSNLPNEEKAKIVADTETKIVKEFEGMSAADEYIRKRIYNTTEGVLGTNRFLD